MKKFLIFLTASLLIALTAKGQNLFFIEEHSYPCSETFSLQSNSDLWYINDLDVVFAKDGNAALFAVSTKTPDLVIRGKLMIYLDDGSVITLNDRGNYDYVDQIASSVYSLTNEELNKLKTSNINTVRYTLVAVDGLGSSYEGNYSASNREGSKIDFPAMVSEFYENFTVKTKNYIDENNKSAGTGTEGISYDLAGRQARSLPKPTYDIQSEGIVVVEITVDGNGNVTQAVPGVKGSTTLDEYFLRVAREAAMKAKFDRKPDAPVIQKGTITYHFILR